jgi:hypothetical protein
MEFANAKLDPGADLQHLMANLFEQIGLEKGAGASGDDFDSYLEDLAEEVGGDPFALHAQMLDDQIDGVDPAAVPLVAALPHASAHMVPRPNVLWMHAVTSAYSFENSG